MNHFHLTITTHKDCYSFSWVVINDITHNKKQTQTILITRIIKRYSEKNVYTKKNKGKVLDH